MTSNYKESTFFNNKCIGTPPLQISTNLLGLSYLPTDLNDDIFKQLNFPHLKRPYCSSSSSNSSLYSTSPTEEEEQEKECNTIPDSIKNKVALSPAASFLAGFMTSPPTATANTSFASLSSIEEDQDNIISDYTIGDTIGFGGFSTVRKAQHNQDPSNIVAVKIINQYLMNDIEKSRLEREINIWKSLHHPRIVQLKKIIHADEKCYILCDDCSKGNLLNYLNKVKKLNEVQARKMFKEICQGVYYLHIDRKVCHKDLKLENILLDDHYHVKICDFGLAIYQKNKKKKNRETAGGSLAYASPEQIKQQAPLTCPKTDIWSLGVILYALVMGYLPFMDTFDLRLQEKILLGHFDIPSELSLPLQQLIKQCLEYDSAKRITIDQVLNSPWLKEGSS